MSTSVTPPFSLAGRTALVTGSTTGLGKALAKCLGLAGARVAMNYANNAPRAEAALAELTAAGVTAGLFRADVTSETEIDGMFTAIEGAPLIALVSWDGTDLYGIDPSGQVLVSSDEGRTWASRGTVAAEPVAATAQGGALAILAGGTVYYSTDGGQSFTPRITGLAGH